MKRDEFETWLKEPVTQYIFKAVRKAAEQEKAEWLRQSWEGGEANPVSLCELRSRAMALTELCDNDFETWKAWSDDGTGSVESDD